MGEKSAENWRGGFPPVPGWYRCRLDGGEVKLLAKKCELTGKWHWVYTDGSYITESVEWTT